MTPARGTSEQSKGRSAEPEVANLRIPRVEHQTFRRNLLRSAVCEFRFPTLLEIETKRPVDFQKAIRRDFPNYGQEKTMQIAPVAGPPETAHIFRSKDQRTAIVLRASSIIVETQAYTNFDWFVGILDMAIKAGETIIDVDSFTRVGLRYINAIPIRGMQSEDIGLWVNPLLVAGVANGIFGTVGRYWHEIGGHIPNGRYTFRHGIGVKEKDADPDYVLDYDFFSEDVAISETLKRVAVLNTWSFSLFSWSIGPETVAILSSEPLED